MSAARSRSLLRVVWPLSIGLLLAACTSATPIAETTVPTVSVTPAPELPPPPTTIPVSGTNPRFESSSCSFISTPGHRAECGYLVVPEDRDDPDGLWVELPVAIFRSQNPNPEPDPVIYLTGGGGFNQMPIVSFYLSLFGDEILRNRDFLVYNQRGAPLADPALQCPGYGSLLVRLAQEGLSKDEQINRKVDFLHGCRDDLVAQGYNLAMFDTTTNAADAHDLRVALGYEQANYYGTSYGTTLGLALLRDHPEGVRSIILDSVQPPQARPHSERIPNAHRTFSKLFEACAGDHDCNATYPDLEMTFYQVIDDLNANPVITTVAGEGLTLDGGIFSEVVYSLLVSADVGSAPRVITRASEGDFSTVGPHLLDILDVGSAEDYELFSEGVFYSLSCREEVPFDSYEEALAQSAVFPPALADHYLFRFVDFHFALCESWGVEPGESKVAEPVVSDIPALILTGQFDPITPPEWAQLTAETLSGSFLYEFPWMGHGVMDSDRCALEIGMQFLDDPTSEPDASCMDGLPDPTFR